MIDSKWSTANCQKCEFGVLRVSSHELLDDQRCHHYKTIFSCLPMVDWLLLCTIHFVQESIFFDKCNKVSLNLLLNLRLTLFNWIFMVLLNVFVFLENFSDFFWSLAFGLFLELLQVWILLNQVGMFLKGIQQYMEQSDSSTGVFGKLFHVKQIGWHFVVLEILSFLFEERSLFFIDFVQKYNA